MIQYDVVESFKITLIITGIYENQIFYYCFNNPGLTNIDRKVKNK